MATNAVDTLIKLLIIQYSFFKVSYSSSLMGNKVYGASHAKLVDSIL